MQQGMFICQVHNLSDFSLSPLSANKVSLLLGKSSNKGRKHCSQTFCKEPTRVPTVTVAVWCDLLLITTLMDVEGFSSSKSLHRIP